MAMAIINGRRVEVPEAATAEDLRQAGGIKPGRRIIRRTREGNYPVKPGERVTVQAGDTFTDAPARVKGAAGQL